MASTWLDETQVGQSCRYYSLDHGYTDGAICIYHFGLLALIMEQRSAMNLFNNSDLNLTH